MAELYLKIYTNRAMLENIFSSHKEHNPFGFYNNIISKLKKYFLYFIAIFIIYFILMFSSSLVVSGQTNSQCVKFYNFNSSLDSSWKNGLIQWQPDDNDYKSYRSSLRSGEISMGETSYINTSLNGPGNVTFWWKKSSVLNSFSDLYFLIDKHIIYIYDDMFFGWQKKSYNIQESGIHELSWAFKLRGYGRRAMPSGQVASWIDDVKITENCQLPIILNGARAQKNVSIDYIHPNPEFYIYPTIQQGIDNVSIGGTIFVRSGIYKENLIISKPLQLIGNNNSNTIIDIGNKAIDIMADNVAIQNFQIRNGDTAIEIFKSSNVSIRNNSIKNSNYGVRADEVNGLLFEYNLVNVRNSSVVLLKSNNCTIKNNILLNNKEDAIKLRDSYRNIFLNNKFIYSESCDIFSINCSQANRYSDCVQCPGQNNPDCWCCS